MAQQEIELILSRQLSAYLDMPIVIVDTQGNGIYYNEAAEVLLGRRFDEHGMIPVSDWDAIFHPTDRHSVPIASATLPLALALQQKRPARRSFWIRAQDETGPRRHIEVTAFPIVGQSGRYLGAVGILWEAGT